jgi:hypothetical protein
MAGFRGVVKFGCRGLVLGLDEVGELAQFAFNGVKDDVECASEGCHDVLLLSV